MPDVSQHYQEPEGLPDLTESHKALRGELIRLESDLAESDFVNQKMKDNVLGMVRVYRHQVELSVEAMAHCAFATAIEARDEAESLADAMAKTGTMDRLDSIRSLLISTLASVSSKNCTCSFDEVLP